jgi:hypothetical protein
MKNAARKIALWIDNTGSDLISMFGTEIRAHVIAHGTMPTELDEFVSVEVFELNGELRARFDLK